MMQINIARITATNEVYKGNIFSELPNGEQRTTHSKTGYQAKALKGRSLNTWKWKMSK